MSEVALVSIDECYHAEKCNNTKCAIKQGDGRPFVELINEGVIGTVVCYDFKKDK